MAKYGAGDFKAGVYVAEDSVMWGTSPWEFAKDTGVLTIELGVLARTGIN